MNRNTREVKNAELGEAEASRSTAVIGSHDQPQIFERIQMGKPAPRRCRVIGSVTPKQENSLQEFGDFIGANSLEYIDFGKSERYKIVKDGKCFLINVAGDRDGGYANFEEL